MLIGVIIEKGPQGWQILQQKDGCADISLSGNWDLDESMENNPKDIGGCMVYARVV